MVLEWNDIGQKEVQSGIKKFHLTFWSDDKETLERLEKRIITMYTRCESCNGEVTPSEDQYLCLSGCGHVKGKLG